MSASLIVTRILLVILAVAVEGCSIFLLARLRLRVQAETWTIWTPLLISIWATILYSWSLSARARGSSISPARNWLAFFLGIGWFVTPAYRLNQISRLAASNNVSFFVVWNCGTYLCVVLMIMDIAGLLAGVLSFLELSLTDQSQKGVITQPAKTSIFVLPGSQQQQYIPLQQQQQQQQQPVQAPYYQPAAQPYYAQQPTTTTGPYPAHY